MANRVNIGAARIPDVAKLPVVALPTVGLRGVAGGAAGYWPAGTPEEIRQSCMLWYDVARQGCTNEAMAAAPVLRDLSGNGHDATCYNFAWSGMSGVGGYAANFRKRDSSLTDRDIYTLTENKLIINQLSSTNKWLLIKASNDNGIPKFTCKVTGLENSEINLIYYYMDEINVRKAVNLTEGLNELPESILFPDATSGTQIGLFASNIPTGTNIDLTIELLPLYPGALVSDGVDDKAVVEGGLKVLNNYTIIAKRKIIDGYGCFLKKGYAGETAGEFLFEGNMANESFGTQNYGYTTTIPLHEEEISWQTLKAYNGIPLEKGTSSGYYNFYMFGLNHYTRTALYSAILFDRDLTEEEIEWVKTNMMQQ